MNEHQEWIPPDVFGRSLRGFGINLLSRSVEAHTSFATSVLGATILYAIADFAALQYRDTVWMVHHDRTYGKHPISGFLQASEARGVGIELHLYERDPDIAERTARLRGDIVLAGAIEKPHGLREVFILDPDGYVWVLSRPIVA
ncbi:MAG: glyoxalase [Pseudomonadota bacterium]